jgi:succinyl-diaminopimelate desuccinylase
MIPKTKLIDLIDSTFPAQVKFLAELVRVPSDNPPGDCAPHAQRTAQLLEGLGFSVERDEVPAAQAHANGMISATNLVIRRRFGDGPTIALNAHGDVVQPGEGWTTDPYGAEIRDGVMKHAARHCMAPLSCISPTTRRPAVRSARVGCWRWA